jgi:hypothetical protein
MPARHDHNLFSCSSRRSRVRPVRRPDQNCVRLDDRSLSRPIYLSISPHNVPLNPSRFLLMSSSERPPSQASTTIESAESANPAPAQSIDEKLDPWLVSFSPDDPENPMVRCACCPFSPPSMCSTFGRHLQNWPRWKRWYITTIGGILVFNSSVHSILGVYLRLIDLPSELFLVLLHRTCSQR